MHLDKGQIQFPGGIGLLWNGASDGVFLLHASAPAWDGDG